MIYGIVGPYANIYGYLELEADIYANPWWVLYGGLESNAGVELEIFDKELADYETKVIDYRVVLAKADGPIADIIPPSIPTNLTATAVSTSQINLSWNASTDDVGVAGYKVFKNGAFLNTSTTTSFSDTGLSPNTPCCYTVSAYDAAWNESGQSAQACVTTMPSGYTISGKVTDSTGVGLSGVTVTLTGTGSSSVTTGTDGTYAFTDAQNGSYTLTPSKAGYTFDPPSRSITVNSADLSGQDFVGTATTGYTISGKVTDSATSTGLSGVTVTLTGTGSNSATTGTDGTYVFTGAQNGNYTITPSKSGYTFNPVNRAVTVNNSDVTGQDFVGTSSGVESRVNLPKTGQTKCYDTAGTEISCAGTGQDGDIQAGVAWPNPRFTVSGDCVTDNLTGLIWAKNGNLPNGTRTWQEALDYVASINSGPGLCGYHDWRLPNVNELESLVNSEQANQATWLNGQGFINVQSNGYLSSTTFAVDTNGVWNVAMWDGNVGVIDKRNYYDYVWPVRAGQSGSPDPSYPANIWKTGLNVSYATGDDGDMKRGVTWPNPRFTDNSNGTVTDNLTGLIWTKDTNAPGPSVCNPGTSKKWQDALDYIKCLNNNSYLGHNDWRLPNRIELRSLIDYSNYNPALPTGHPFTNVQSYGYWSSSAGAASTSVAWIVAMWNGYRGYYNKEDYDLYVWPVRAGQ
jgi:hypothetical protein